MVGPERAAELKAASGDWPSWTLDGVDLDDLELLTTGAYAPLAGYLDRADHAAVQRTGRLADGTLWPLPLSLPVDRSFADTLAEGDPVALRDPEGTMLAVLTVMDRFSPASGDDGSVLLGGPVEVLQPPNQYDFTTLRRTPAESRQALAQGGHARVVALPTDLPLVAADLGELRLLVNSLGARVHVLARTGTPAVEPPPRLDRAALVRVLRAGLAQLPDSAWLLTVAPIARRLPDPGRQALLDARVARAHGATHVMAPPDADAAAMLVDHASELGVEVVPGPTSTAMTAADVEDRLADGRDVSDAIAPAAVLAELRRAIPPRHERGFTVFFTGLSGSGKSTVANVVAARLREEGGGRRVSLLDGDLVRRHLSSELGFSREHRNVNVLRIGWVASEVTRHGGMAVCAPIAPYDDIRRQNRQMVEATGGGYVLVHVSTPLEVCEARDRKGLYAKARAGVIQEFTVISDPYEDPTDADLAIDTTDITPAEAAEQVVAHLHAEGWLADA